MEQYQQNWKNYYKVLNVSPTAEPQIITSAYRKLALKYHPDVAQGVKDSRKIIELNEAYEVLSNSNRRIEYDRIYNAKIKARGGTNSQSEPSNLYNQFQQPTKQENRQAAKNQARTGFFIFLGGIAGIILFLVASLFIGTSAAVIFVILSALFGIVGLAIILEGLRKYISS